MRQVARYLTGAAAMAAVMYWLDPTSGRRRRARTRDRLMSVGVRMQDGLRVTGRDLTHRLQGLVAAACHAFGKENVEDEVLIQRVRSQLGRSVSHPGSIEVQAVGGLVTLSGPILTHEHEALLRAVRAVRGVREIDDRLVLHDTSTGVSALQGGRPRQHRFELMQENWSPTARLLTGLAGGALLLYGSRSRGVSRYLSIGAGGALLLRSATNIPLTRLAGAAERRAIDIHRTIHVRAPVTEVFETLAHYENFPAFMRNVRGVRVHGDGRSHWIVAGPAGTSVKWDSETTRYEPNQLLAWRTVPHSVVEHEGVIRFEPFNNAMETRLDIQMSYRPPAGALGHAVAKLFGADPKKEIDEDLVRLKSFLETGKLARDSAVARGYGRLEPGSLSTESVPPIH